MKNLTQYDDPFSSEVKAFALDFDAAYEKNDKKRLIDLMEKAKSCLSYLDVASQAQLHYSLGTVYGDLSTLDSNLDCIDNVEKQIYHFRKSIELIESKELDEERFSPYIKGLKLALYTNYANSLENIGRKISAIDYYKKALIINPSFGMAIGNIGIAFYHYGALVYDKTHRDYFHHFAYEYLNLAITSGTGIHQQAKEEFKNRLNSYDKDYVQNFLSNPLEIPQFTYDEPDELAYRKWALKNKLFLNPLNDLHVEELCFASDVLQLPNMIVKIDAKPIYHGMFNQLKQEFIFTRYQYYQSLQYPDEPHFADKDTYLISTADYPQYSIRIERMKTAFRVLYSLLDKIAFFINAYFKLGIKERDVSYRSIWLTEKPGDKGYKYKNTLNPSENYPLNAICWICKDFFDALYESPNPAAKRVSDLRNALEHKYVKVFSDTFITRTNGEIDDLAEYVSESELQIITMQLLKDIREALINLSLAVYITEQKNNTSYEGDYIPKIRMMGYDDEWKI